VYTIHGDEPLLALEAADAVRTAARQRGCSEREVLHVERGFDWSALAHAGASQSLFGGARIVELRIATGKPGTEGASAIERYCAADPGANVTLVTLPRLDRTTQSSGWFSALASAGVIVDVWPVDRARLPQWIAGAPRPQPAARGRRGTRISRRSRRRQSARRVPGSAEARAAPSRGRAWNRRNRKRRGERCALRRARRGGGAARRRPGALFARARRLAR
jgi:hypothetical protein